MDCKCLTAESCLIEKKPKISGTPPGARYNHSAVLAGSRIVIFGGKGEKKTVFRDLHALDPVTMTWYQVKLKFLTFFSI